MTLPALTLSLDSLSVPLTSRFGTIGSGTKKLAFRYYARKSQSHPGAWICELWLANALAGMEIIDWIYLSIAAPMGMTLAAYPRVGMRVAAGSLKLGTGATQCFPTRRGIAPIRFVLNGPASLMDEGVIPDVVTNFGALGQKQPKVDRTKYAPISASDLEDIRLAISEGSAWTPHMPGLDTECGIMHPALGVWLPLGPSSPGNPGGDNPAGSDIRFLPGYDQTLAGALLERERMDRVIERSLHAWDAHGNYLTVESFGDPGPQYSGSRDPWSTDAELPGFNRPGVGLSTCLYRDKLDAVGAYGAAHLERAINPTLVAWEYLHDPVAADFMVDLAEEMRLQFSNFGPVAAATDSWQPRNLRNYLAMANRNPHHGGDCGRYRGVPAWCVATAHHIRPSASYVAWMTMWVQWCDEVQQPNGLWQYSVGDAQFHNPPGVAAAQMFETIYVAVAREACGRAIGEVQPGAPALLAYSALFCNRKLPKKSYPYNLGAFGPDHFLAVGNSTTGEPYPVISSGWGPPGDATTGDVTNVELGISRAWHISGGAVKYRDALLAYGVPAPTIAAKATNCLAGLDLNWNAGAVSAIQQAQAESAP